MIRLWFFFLFVFSNNAISGQLCTGSLGDPVVNITFGSGISTGSPYTPSGAYTFIASECPNDGFYTIINATQNCFGNSWHTVSSDHTGGGNFMLVNASFTPGDFFRATVTDLCPNTTYEFASWAMNVLRSGGIAPDLTFSIEEPDGTLLGQFSTGPILTSSSPQWRQYGFYFTTPSTNPEVILRITNNAPGGIGNDLALDDITFRPCGPTVTATIAGVSGEINLCEKDTNTYTFLADAGSTYVSPAYQWQVSTDSGASWQDIGSASPSTFYRRATTSGHYWYRFAVTEEGAPTICRINSNVLVINVWPIPIADAGPDRVLLIGDTLQLKARTDSNNTYSWTPTQYLSNPGSLTPRAFPPNPMRYEFDVVSAHGCTNKDWMEIRVVDDLYIPTAFTPNNDGRNDSWRIPYLDPDWNPSVKIYNRYGQLIYEADGISIRWDGTFRSVAQGTGVYVYHLTLRAKGIMRKGTIMLIR